jgi:hypothetical protein
MSDLWDDFYVPPYKASAANMRDNQVPGLYSILNITGVYLDSGDKTFEFSVGNYQFSPNHPQGQDGRTVPRCEVTEWDESAPMDDRGRHSYRNTTCWVYC